MQRTVRIRLFWLIVLVGLLMLAVVASLAMGVRTIGWDAVWQVLFGHTESIDQAVAAQRIPRTVLAGVIGATLVVSGVTMQAVTRNPLADPGIFGVLAGALLFVVIGLAFFHLAGTIPIMVVAVIGSAVAAAFVYAVGSLGHGGATPLKLALAGAATSAALSSMVSAVLLPRQDVMDRFRFWQIGEVGGADWESLSLGAPLLIIGGLICWASATSMNALALGDDVATSLGTHVVRARAIAAAGAVMLCGAATALAGPIGFVGLIVPHICRFCVGADHRWLVPFSAVVGALILIACDTIGRILVDHNDIAVGVIMPVMGAPLFIWIVRQQKVREL